MQPEFLARLSASVQEFVLEVERESGVAINVYIDPKQNKGGTAGQGKLAVVINAQSAQILVPTNSYFPDGAVRHEVLHVKRFLVECVPKLTLADDEDWDKDFSDALGALDNAIEHLVIVPLELEHHPERRKHWESVMKDVCLDLSQVPEGERRLVVCLHWTFIRRVLPSSPMTDVIRDFAVDHGLLEMANRFFEQFISAAESKEELIRLIFHTFPEIPRRRAALEYINSVTGTTQKPIP